MYNLSVRIIPPKLFSLKIQFQIIVSMYRFSSNSKYRAQSKSNQSFNCLRILKMLTILKENTHFVTAPLHKVKLVSLQ